MIDALAYLRAAVATLDGNQGRKTCGPRREEVGAQSLPGRSGERRKTIRDKLLASHLRVAVIGFGMLIVALVCMEFLRANGIRLARDRGPAVSAALKALAGVERSIAELSGWVAFKDPAFRERRAAAWRYEIAPAAAGLRRARWLHEELAWYRWNVLEKMLDDLERVQDRVEALARTPEDVAGEEEIGRLMAREVVPLGRRLASFLRGVSAGQIALMEADAATVSLAGRIGLVLSVALILAMALFAWRASLRGAQDITRPIARLAAATEDLAAGRLQEDIPITDDDEIGELTAAFNRMRAYLEQATSDIRLTANQLAEATALIMAATTQQAKGTREQTAAIRNTVEAVLESARVADGVVRRARQVCNSVESANAATAAGRRALEKWGGEATELKLLLATRLGTQPAQGDGSGEIVDRFRLHAQEFERALERLALLLTEAEQLAGETERAVDAQAHRLEEAQRVIGQMGVLADETFARTIQVERVAQKLKDRSRELRTLVDAYAVYAPYPELPTDG